MKFNIRIKDLELRSCGKHLLQDGEHDTAEIVRWKETADEEPFCYTVAYWVRDSEGPNLKFVGERPFDTDLDILMALAKTGQDLLRG